MDILRIRISALIMKRINALADNKGATISAIGRELIEQGLSRQDIGQAIAALSRQLADVQAAVMRQEETIRQALRPIEKPTVVESIHDVRARQKQS